MFYSHEILTSRKHGVATVWLVATLGSSSHLKKVNRKAILNVDVPKACDTIVASESPMALRLQSNLMYGVARVYSQQCGYILSDAQSTQQALKLALLTMKQGKSLDLETARTARPEQLLLQDDPSFLPDFTFELGAVDIEFNPPTAALLQPSGSVLSPLSSASMSRSSFEHSLPGIEIPSSVSRLSDEPFGYKNTGPDISSVDFPAHQGEDDGDFGFFLNPDFAFDEEGNLIESDPTRSVSNIVRRGEQINETSHAEAVSDVRGPKRKAANVNGMAARDITVDNMEGVIPSGSQELVGSINADDDDYRPDDRTSETSNRHDQTNSAGTSAVASLANLAPKKVKPLQADEVTQLRHRVIKDWQFNYNENMEKSQREKLPRRENYFAKKNAELWTWGHGLGGIGKITSPSDPAWLRQHPLGNFAGPMLFQRLTGAEPTASGSKKRDRENHTNDHDEDQSEDGRRVRQRSETGNAHELTRDRIEDEGFTLNEDESHDVELARHGATPLSGSTPQDISTLFPWNMFGTTQSRQKDLNHPKTVNHASKLSTPTLATAMGRNIIGLSSRASSLGLGSASHPIPSPSAGHLNSFTPVSNRETDVQRRLLHDELLLSTSQRLADSLDTESFSFVEFVHQKIANLPKDEVSPTDRSITFANLLPPEETPRLVAVQGFVNLLSLASKGIFYVEQQENSDEIMLQVVDNDYDEEEMVE